MPRLDNIRWRWAVYIVLLVTLYLLPRLVNLDGVVTTDEPFWLGRSANFFNALWHGRLEDTYQFAHPGVTTMWTGMVGYWFTAPDYVRVFDTNFEFVYDIHQRIRAMGHSEMDVLIAARVSKVVLQGALFAVSITYIRRLFGELIAIVSGVTIALDPFLISHDRLLHVDGLLAISSLAAVLAIAAVLSSDRNRTLPWIIAGVLAAIAWLTRSTVVVLVGVAGIALLIDAITDRTPTPLLQRLWIRLRSFAIWSGAAFVTTVALWPALWVSPVDTLTRMFEWATGAASEGHELPIYFMGTIDYGDPGLLFYPVTVLWRESIAGTVGLVLFLGVLIGGGVHARLRPVARRALWVLLLFAALYLIGMSLGAKKFDRYILPVYPVLNTAAAIGILTTVRWLVRWRPQLHRFVIPALLGGLLLIQTLVTLSARPYYLDAYNPLLGGATSAQDVLQMGWGEGVGQAAEYIIDDTGVAPGDEVETPPVVRISGGRAPLLYALPPPFIVEPSGFTTESDWNETRYYVATIQQWQRDISGDVIGYLEGYEPDHTVWVEGVEFVRVYDLRDIPPPDWLTGSPDCQWQFPPSLRLENIVMDGDQATFWFQTLDRADLPVEVTIDVGLIPRSEDVTAAPETSWTDTFEPRRGTGWFTSATLEIALPDGTDIDDYLMKIAVTDAETGAPLPAIAPGDTISQDAAIVSPTCGDEDAISRPAETTRTLNAS